MHKLRKLYLLHVDVSDIDECSEESSNECDANADCKNTEGSYSCRCREDYFGDGKICSGKQFKFISFYYFQHTIQSFLFNRKTLRTIKPNMRKCLLKNKHGIKEAFSLFC